MTTTKARAAVIPAAGRGVRFGSESNKVFALLGGVPVITRTLRALSPYAESLVIVGRADEQDALMQMAEGVSAVVQFAIGGATRQESVARGLTLMADAAEDAVVFVHDGVRPLVSGAVIEGCIAGALEYGAAVAAVPIADTLKSEAGGFVRQTLERAGIWSVQTPQAFRLGVLRAAHAAAERDGFIGTDEASLAERLPGQKVCFAPGSRENIKITTPDDLVFAEKLCAGDGPGEMRVGLGYDIHRFSEAADRKLWLGGVEITNSPGLDGHSDADVLLHAVCDALLGAAGQPDIGHLFPNTDPAYAGVSSLTLLAAVTERLAGLNWQVSNVDVMLIAEKPKIAPHAPLMRARIAETLKVQQERISIKATTNEGIGALGAGSGIACHATAAIVRR